MRANSCIVYFLTQSLFLGFGIVALFMQSGKDCYLAAILGLLLGFIFMYGFNYFINMKNKRDLKDILKQNKVLGFIARIVILIISYIILIYALVIYKIFVSSFLLIKTPEIFLLIPFVVLGAYAAFKSLKVISRVAEALLPLSIILSLVSFVSVSNICEVNNFLPILTTGPSNFFKAVITFASISVFPNILTIHFRENNKGYLKMYVLSSLIIIISLLIVNGVFGPSLVNIFRFPEYMVLKQLKLFQFIEKVENILSISWIFALFFTVTMAIYSIKELVFEKKPKTITTIILILTIILIDKTFAFDYVYEVKLFYMFPYVALISVVLALVLLLIIIKMKNKNKLSKDK